MNNFEASSLILVDDGILAYFCCCFFLLTHHRNVDDQFWPKADRLLCSAHVQRNGIRISD